MSIKTNNLFYTYFSKRKNTTYTLRNINIDIPSNAFTAILGKTGSGKSTLLQTLNAIILPMDGTVSVDEFLITPHKKKNKNIKELRKHLGVVFQFPEYQLFEETILKDVAFGPKNFGLSEEEANQKAKDALSLFSIDSSFYERSPFELSGGERRKIALAGILAIDPEIVVFDEPTAGLDNKSVEELLHLISILRNKGKTIIMVTHDMDIVYQYADNILLLDDGNVVYFGSPFDFFFKNENYYSLETPHIVEVIKEAKKYQPTLNEKKIKTINDFVNEVKR